MDFNPLDILAAAALGEKDAPPEIKNSETDQSKSPGQTEDIPSLDAQDVSEADAKTEMGKSGSNGLKQNPNCETREKSMAPQKTPWSPDSLLQLSPESQPVQTDAFCLDDIVKDIKTKGLDVELKKAIGKNFVDDDCLKHDLIDNPHILSLKNGQNNNIVIIKNKINSSLNEGLSKSILPVADLQNDTEKTKDVTNSFSVADDKSVDSGVSGGECSPDSDSVQFDPWILDHPYAMVEGQRGPQPCMDNDDIDVCSDLSPLAEDSEQRPRNMALDCNYLKSGMDGVSASSLDVDLYGMTCSPLGRTKLPSSSSSTSSPTTDLGSRSCNNYDNFTEPAASKSPNSSSSSPNKACPKFGKFKIGTFASFSSSNLELEKYLRNQDPTNHKKLNIGIPSEPHAVESTYSPLVQPLLQSPSLDWDRSEAGSETQDDSCSDSKTPHRLSPDFTSERVTEWSHPMYHDHDYCTKDEYGARPENFKKLTTVKRKYTKRKKMDLVNHEKIMKAKYLKEELLKKNNFLKSPVESEPPVIEDILKSNPVGRPRKKALEKLVDEEIDPETGTKLKITGKFQDQYVYYLSKSSRTTTRRRQAPTLPLFPDKIIVPAPKPGDIVVHHLTDSDIETVRLKGRGALNLPERPNHTNTLPTSTTLSSLSTPCPCPTSQSNDTISDVDIVSTILSMENDNLSSPTTSHASTTDFTSTTGINPHQPALTESLRMVSGDPSITSEHVLNYLLSVVKEDQLLGSGNGFDTSTSALYPSIPPDAIYSRADNGDLGSLYPPTSFSSSSVGQDIGDKNSLPVSVSDVTSSQLQGPYQFAHNSSKHRVEGNMGLPDDFPSFMSNSQESSSNCSQHDVDSQGSLKSVFGSDVSSLGTPQLSNSVPRLTSIEKTLDYLGVNDGEIKLDSNYSGSYVETPPMKEENKVTCLPDHESDETPWIVTVTLYFNDVPAIMVNSEPFIRLVDIHKQILPAKDTGILKKRCQLLNIPVLNCNEMQRYFLVQYGRAYNSKSTLIISKDQATKLVTYYAMPQPRTGKAEDSQHRRPSSCGSDPGTRSPVTCSQPGVFKRKGLHKAVKKTTGLCAGSPLGGGESLQKMRGLVVSKDESDANQSKRTRHKKVNYLEMLKGEERISSEDSILETIEAVVKSAPDYVKAEKVGSKKKKSKKSRKDQSSSDKKEKGSKSKKKSSKSKKRDKKERKHGHKERHSSKKHLSKSLATDSLIVKHPSLSSDVDPEASVDHSQNKKFKPLKLKVHSLLNFAGQKRSASSSPSSASPSPAKKASLFSRSNSVVASTSPVSTSPEPITQLLLQSTSSQHHQHRTPRILAVAHQAASAQSSGESRLPSQPADIHLDLFTRPSSACVRCRTCSQFLSVPHFMRHHHVPMDNQWLASEAAHRILVPLASSEAGGNIGMSERERRLWEEFHRLQEAIGGFGEGDDESDSEVDFDDDEEGDVDEDGKEEEDSLDEGERVNSQRNMEVLRAYYDAKPSAVLSPGAERLRNEDVNIRKKDTNASTLVYNVSSVVSKPNSVNLMENKKTQPSEASLSKAGLLKRDSAEIYRMTATITPRMTVDSHVRHSSRKRKSKQFFSIENYDTVPSKTLEDNQANNSAPYG